VEIDSVRRSLMVDELAADVDTFRFERLNSWPALAGLSWGERVAALLPSPVVAVWAGELVGALESAPDGSSWGAALSDGRHVDCRAWPRLGDAVAWLVEAAPTRVLMHDAVAKQLVGVDLPVERVAVSDAKAATALLRDSAAGLSWSGVLAEQLARVEVSWSAGVAMLDAGRSSGSVAGVKAAAWAFWAAATTPSEVAAIF
jgi:hypothetical protein